MNEKEAFKYCPRCGGKLSTHAHYKDHLKCKDCSFNFFLNSKPCIAAVCVRNNKVLLTKRNFDPYKKSWEFPGGFVDKDEMLEEALEREIQEELNSKLSNFKYLFSVHAKYPLNNIIYEVIMSYFLVSIKGTIRTNKEIADYNFFELGKLPENIHPGHKKAIELLKKDPNFIELN